MEQSPTVPEPPRYSVPLRVTQHSSTGETGISQQNPQAQAETDEELVGPASSTSEKQGWRYKGYPAFSTWMASSDDAFVVRRFGTVHARTILMLQDKIVRLEAQLEEDDRRCMNQRLPKSEEYLANNGSIRKDELYRPHRTAILEELVPLLEQYDRLVWYHSELKSRPEAPRRAVKNVQSWLENNEYAIADEETQFIKSDKDLIAMVHRPKTPLRRFFEQFGWFERFYLFREKKLRSHHYTAKYSTDRTIYYNDTAVDVFVTGTILVLGLGMLLGPAWWLQRANSLILRLEIVSIFVPLFLVLLLLVAPLRPFETMAATSAYAAVLVVFVQGHS